jgi:hypothetical protein
MGAFWEDAMRAFALGLAVFLAATPAHGAWQWYACASDNFALQMPGVPKVEAAKFAMPRHGAALSARTYSATVDNMVYRMMVADYSDRVADGASILSEAMFQHTDSNDHGLIGGKTIANDATRIENPARGATYGRTVTIDAPKNGGRNITAFYFRDGHLYEQTIQILPASGDYTTPYASRFIDSLLFNLSRLDEETGGKHEFIESCGRTIKPFTYK